jgi:hypothetical protein
VNSFFAADLALTKWFTRGRVKENPKRDSFFAADLALTELQDDHVYILEQEAPQVAAIRTELCPAFMSEERFWRVYFVLLASRLGTAQAAQLLTPDVGALVVRSSLFETLTTISFLSERLALAVSCSVGGHRVLNCHFNFIVLCWLAIRGRIQMH